MVRDLPRLTRRGLAPQTGIVHMGPGAFFRAFSALYTQEAVERAGGDWGITAVSLRSPEARDQLTPQGGAYTAVELGPQGTKTQQVEVIGQVLVAPEDPEAVIAAMADPNVRIVSLTVTEKGYCHNPATGALMLDHPGVQNDLRQPGRPETVPGFLVAALMRRRAAGEAPFTVLSCDNLPNNGALVQGVVLDFARHSDADLADWIASEVAFPSTMVDRITPATTQDDIDRLAQTIGAYDPACVSHEPFRQWVIEDRFVAGRPAWDDVGAQIVDSVEAHEAMKLRCLNGTHSSLAYLAYLAGHETIAETVADPPFAAFCTRLWADEIVPTLTRPEGEDLDAYCASLMQRYQNPAIRHRTWQIAMDGSQKLPQRLLGTIADDLAADRVPHGLCLAVAAWMRYVGGVDETGAPIDVRDPLAEALKAASDAAQAPEDKVAALLAITAVFDPVLVQDARFRDGVTQAYVTLASRGARHAVEAYLEPQS